MKRKIQLEPEGTMSMRRERDRLSKARPSHARGGSGVKPIYRFVP